MTFTGNATSSGNEGEIQINNEDGTTTTDANLIFDTVNKSLTVSGKIEQKVSNLTLIDQYALGSVKGMHFQGSSIFVTRGNDVLKLNDQGDILASTTLVGTADQIINDGLEIYVLTTVTDTLSVLDQDLNVISIITDPTNLPSPTRFIRHGKFLFIACGAKLSKFNTSTKSITGTLVINADTFVDLVMKGDSLITLRQTSVSEINATTMTIVKNVPNSDIINPRRIKATRNNVYVLCSTALLTFDTLLKYKGKRTTGLSDASTIAIYGSFLIVSNGTGGLSIYDASTIPSTLLNVIPMQVSPNNFKTGIVVGSNYYLTDSLSGILFKFTIDGIIAGGIKAGSAEITSVTSTDVNAEVITATNINTTNFYTSGNILGTSGTLGGITLGNGIISGSNIQIDSGNQSLIMDTEGFKYTNNSETVVQFKNNGTFESASIETEVFKISNGVNKFQISASPDLIADQLLIFPSTGGAAGDMLSNDGTGVLTWRAIDPAEITIPGGFTSHVQFNTNGIFSGSSKFKWDNDNDILSIGENNEITLSRDTDNSVSSVAIGKVRLTYDTAGPRIELLDATDVVKLVADYNTTDGATITLGSVIVSESSITGLSAPTNATDAANKSYVDSVTDTANSSPWKTPVRVTTTVEIPTFPPTDGVTTVSTLDGVTIVAGDRVLIKDQTTDPIENGIYVVTETTWERAIDLADGSQAIGATVKVLLGDKYALTTYNGTSGDTVGTDATVFEQATSSSGVSWKKSVRVATTAEITPFPPTDGITTVTTIDGVTLVVGDRVLVKEQSTGTQNGIYVITETIWERSIDFDTDDIVAGSAMWVNEGTTNADQGWVCISDTAIVDTSSLSFDIMAGETVPGGADTQIQFNSSGTTFAGSADLTWNGTTLKLPDDKTITLGTTDDLIFSHTGTLSKLESNGSVFTVNNTTGTLTLSSTAATGKSIILKQGSTGGSTDIDFQDSAGASTLRLTGDALIMVGVGKSTILSVRDNSKIGFGQTGGGDCFMQHNGTDMSIINSTGSFTIDNATATDLVLKIGDNAGATSLLVKSSTGVDLLNVSSSGDVNADTFAASNVKLNDTGTNNITLKSPATLASNVELTLPGSVGAAGSVLTDTAGNGTLSWVDNTVTKTSVTQLTSVNTTVDINSKAGKITTVSLAILSHETEQFTVTNISCTADSIVLCNVISYNGAFNLHCGVTNISAGSFDVVMTNSAGGSLNAAAVIGFFII